MTLAILLLAACPEEGKPHPTPDLDSSPTDEVVDEDGDGSPADEDCDDADPDTRPGAPEVCDGADDDCDGDVDEGVTTTWYADEDGDTYGDAAASWAACDAGEGVADATDCDDADAGVNPGAAEACDGVDNDCDGATDEDAVSTWYADADGDGWGDPQVTAEGCDAIEGYVAVAGDCDDGDASVVPGTWDPAPDGFFYEAVATDTSGIAAGDVDGDGILDLAIASPTDLVVDVWRGDGHGGFSLAAEVSMGSAPRAVAVGDFDGDGDADLAVAGATNNLVFREGYGDGSFGSGGGTATGCAEVVGLAAGDLDGDGLDDVAVGCSDPAFVAMLATGGGAFSATALAPDGPAELVVLADLDLDGDLDGAMAGDGGDTAYLFWNDGAGGFTGTEEGLRADTDVLAAGDVDGDGDVDLVTGTPYDYDLVLLENDGTGNLVGAMVDGPWAYTSYYGTTTLYALDPDGDGDDDLLANGALFEGTAAGPAYTGTSPSILAATDGLVGADLDGDGLEDVAGVGNGLLNAELSLGDGTFQTGARLVEEDLSFAATGDLDGDGDADVAGVVADDTLAWYLNDGEGAFELAGEVTAGNYHREVVVGDLDGDGDNDLAATSAYGVYRVELVFLDGAGGLQATDSVPLTGSGAELRIADVDGDGDSDLVAVEFTDDGFTTLLNDGAGGFTSAGLTTVAVGDTIQTLAVGDVTGDGLPDVVTSPYLDATLHVFEGDGAGGFSLLALVSLPDYAEEVVAGDADEDGDVDLLVGVYQNGTWVLARNDGDGSSFATTTLTTSLTSIIEALTLHDVDGDGHADLVLNDWSEGLLLLGGDGTGTFTEREELEVVVASTGRQLAFDANGDGAMDVGILGREGMQVLLQCPE